MYLISLSYNGKNFHGWQIQPNAKTVQDELQQALSIILQEKVALTGAGRTDAGVHASFYVANFDLNKKINNEQKLIRNLNGFLKKDIVIYDVFEVKSDFNSRFDAISRTYHYFINKYKNPFTENFAFYYQAKLNIKMMNEATKILFEYTDFSSFEKLHSDNKTSRCKIYEAKWNETPNQIILKIKADRFLRNMVRSIVGTILDVGREKISCNDFRQIIESKKRSNAGTSAKACGLFLSDIQYPESINDKLNNSRKKSVFNYDFSRTIL